MFLSFLNIRLFSLLSIFYLFYLRNLSTSAFSVSICGSLKCSKNRAAPILLSSLSLHFALLHNQQRNELHFLIFFLTFCSPAKKKSVLPLQDGTNYFLLVCFCRLVDTSTYTLSSSEPFSYNLEIVTFLNFCIL